MSHFTVTVRVTAKGLAAKGGGLNDAVAELLAPFEESPKRGSPFLVFDDKDGELRKEYAEGTFTRVRTPSGELLSPYAERSFRTHHHRSHRVPDDCVEVEVPFREVFSYEEFATDYHGYLKGPDGHFGLWHNPRARWDWWVVGGRWSGFYPLKPGRTRLLGECGSFDNEPEKGRGDIVHVSDIDMDTVAAETREAAEKFWTEWTALLDGKRFPMFEGPRERAVSLGLLEVVQGPATSTATTRAIPWTEAHPSVKDARRGWHDVAKLITRDDFLREYVECFSPILTYAALDSQGWHAPGEMGWWVVDRSEPSDKAAFQREFVKQFIRTAAPDDMLVVCDCHI